VTETSEKVYTYDEVKAILEEIVRDFGADYSYKRPATMGTTGSNCYYVHENEDGICTPGCIIGHLLDRLNLINLRETVLSFKNAQQIEEFLRISNLEERFTRKARNLMYFVQMKQDMSGTPWSEALAYGIDQVSDLNESGWREQD